MRDMQRTLGLLFCGFVLASAARAQDTLPSFSAAARGNGKVIISWHNNFQDVSQINIQRSSDSLKNFTTLLSVPDPTLPENGAVDNRATTTAPFYRLFVVQQNGKYFFTKSRRPAGEDYRQAGNAAAKLDSQMRVVYIEPAGRNTRPDIKSPNPLTPPAAPAVEVKKYIFIKKGDSLIGQIPTGRIPQYRDSLLTKTKDTLIFIDGDSLLIKPFVPKETYRISNYVFTGKFGNVQLALPDAGKKHYAVKFYDENNKFLFELTSVKDPSLILDKTNFLHAGWFRFELYEGGQLKEKNKFFIPKDF